MLTDQASAEQISAILGLSPLIRYVAVYRDGCLHSRQAPHVLNASSSESDKYEELIVNPALLLLARQRGNIDCGGAKYVLVGYGSFTQLVVDTHGGHASVAFELGVNPFDYLADIGLILSRPSSPDDPTD
jgi:hypothetical protein